MIVIITQLGSYERLEVFYSVGQDCKPYLNCIIVNGYTWVWNSQPDGPDFNLLGGDNGESISMNLLRVECGGLFDDALKQMGWIIKILDEVEV